MKSLLSIILLSLPLSVFAFPEEYYMEASVAQVENSKRQDTSMTVIIEDLNLEATAENALKVCTSEGLTKAVTFKAAVNEQGSVATLLNVVCK